MWRALLALWLTLAVAIATVCVLAQFWIAQRDDSAAQRVEELLLAQLVPVDRTIAGVVDDYSFQLRREFRQRDLADPADCVSVKRLPIVQALVVVGEDSNLKFPMSLGTESTDVQSLVDEARQLLSEHFVRTPRSRLQSSVLNRSNTSEQQAFDSAFAFSADDSAGNEDANTAQSLEQSRPAWQNSTLYQGEGNQLVSPLDQDFSPAAEPNNMPQNDARKDGFGWLTWYHRRGMVLGFWWEQADQTRALAALPRARWMADIVASLPDSDGRGESPRGTQAGEGFLSGMLQQLVDVEGKVIYQWGDASEDAWGDIDSRELDAELPLQAPLEGWRLRAFASPELAARLAGQDWVLPIWFAVGGIATALVVGGLVVSLSLDRQVRLARSRVSFVNQVSHELRTPLTNIRMYADLLAADLGAAENGDEDWQVAAGELDKQRDRLTVIRAESDRLSRLIGNVLRFARIDRDQQELKRECLTLDEMVKQAVETFAPRFKEAGFEVLLNLQTPELRSLAPDAVEQILINLLSNAEKYAIEGKQVSVTTKGDEANVEIFVCDRGRGIPSRMKKRIFEPFTRLGNRLEDPAGTGIGLTIVRDLSRRHGGNCELLSSNEGAAFRCTLHAPVLPAQGSDKAQERS
ncbi:MAG: sensor histidine kinase [Pirellulaceae bacterium]